MDNNTSLELMKILFKEREEDLIEDLTEMFKFFKNDKLEIPVNPDIKEQDRYSLRTLVDYFYEEYGKSIPTEEKRNLPEGFEDSLDFYKGLSNYFAFSIKTKVKKISTKEEDEENLSETEKVYLESCRKKLVEKFSREANVEDFSHGLIYKVASKEIQNCSLTKVKTFVDILKENNLDMINYHSNEIKRLEENASTSFSDSFSKATHEIALNFYKNSELLETGVHFLRNKQLLRESDEILSTLLNKNIDLSKFQGQIELLQDINNLIVCLEGGLIDKDFCFNGQKFVCKYGKYVQDPFVAAPITDVINQLPSLNRSTQSILAYDEEYVKTALRTEKYPITQVKVPADGDKQTTLTLYSGNHFLNKLYELNEYSYPLFIKSVTRDDAKQTIEAMMFCVSAPDIAYASQICRIDKIEPTTFDGSLSKHKQASGDVVVTDTHIHGYNLFDKVLNTSSKKAGHFDISHNILLKEQLTNDQVEEYFDKWCSISGEKCFLNDSVYITNSEDYKNIETKNSPEIGNIDFSQFLREKIPTLLAPIGHEEDFSLEKNNLEQEEQCGDTNIDQLKGVELLDKPQ